MENQIPQCFYRTSVKAFITDENERFLLLQEEKGVWELPGGGLDFGENPHSCLKREIFEEMGLQVTNISNEPVYFFTALHPTKDVWIANVVYKVEVATLDFIPSKECIALGFFTKEEALELKELNFNVREFCQHF